MQAPETPGQAEEAASGVSGLGKQRPEDCPGTLTGRGQFGGGLLHVPQGANLRGQDPALGISCSALVSDQTWVGHSISQSLSFLICKMGTIAALSF